MYVTAETYSDPCKISKMKLFAKILNDFQLLTMVFEHVHMRPEVNSSRFEIRNRFEMSFRLHGNLDGDFNAATFQTIAKLYCTCANDIFKLMQT